MSTHLSRQLGARVLFEPEHRGRSVLKARFSAADHGTALMTDDGAGRISQWVDRVNGLTLTATGNARPLWQATGAMPFPDLKFDGITNCFVNTSFSSILPVGSTPGWMVLIASTNSVAASLSAIQYGSAGVNLRGIQKDGSDRFSVTDGTSLLTDVSTNKMIGPRILIGAWAGTTETGRLNGDYSSTPSTVISALATGTSRLRIGANNNPGAGGFYNGEIYEILFFQGTPTLADFQQIETWAYDQYNLASLLPPGHPGGALTPFGAAITRVYGNFIDGQSLGNGDGSQQPITLNPLDPGRAVSFSGGPRVLDLPQGSAQLHTLLTPANVHSFIDLRETRDQVAGETMCSLMAHKMLEGLPSSSAVLTGTVAIGASDFPNIFAGSEVESNFVTCHRQAKRICLAEGLDFQAPAWVLMDGESEHLRTTYVDDLLALQARREAFIQSITGHTETVPIILAQEARISGSLSRLAQYEAWRLYPDKFILVGPEYNLPVQGPTDQSAFHFTNVSCARMGALMGRVWRTFVEGGTWTPLHIPVGGAVRTGNSIVVTFSGGTGNLVEDITNISPLADGFKGFTWIQSGGAPVSISNVAITDAANKQITITLTDNPGEPVVEQISIAQYGEFDDVYDSPGGPIYGPRCNFRDSDPVTVPVTVSGVTTTWPMYNYPCTQVIDVVT